MRDKDQMKCGFHAEVSENQFFLILLHKISAC